jgi:hypothetical protein
VNEGYFEPFVDLASARIKPTAHLTWERGCYLAAILVSTVDQSTWRNKCFRFYFLLSMSNEMFMFAPRGHKVRLMANFVHHGYPGQRESAKQYLRLGEVYTVKETRVYQSSSTVELEEVPGRSFNSIYFESLTPLTPEQEQEVEQQHPDYIRYTRPVDLPPAAE